MRRREFLATCAIGYASLFAEKSDAKEGAAGVYPSKNRRFNVAFDFDLSHVTRAQTALWVPLPPSNDFQSVGAFAIEAYGKEYTISSSNSYGANALYIKWDKEEQKKLTVSFLAQTSPLKNPLKPRGAEYRLNDYIKSFTKPTRHVQTDGIVSEISNKISANKKDPIAKARAIYDWVVENMYRDPNVKGCGAGDAKEALEQKRYGGKCLDISAVFVALLRAQNIPAREIMGVRLGSSYISKAFGASSDITGAQHCRAEFFIEGYGWIRSDPADITKLRLTEGIDRGSAREKEIADLYFGSFESNWMALNHARDFELYPKPVQFPLDQFNYPYAEADDEVLDFYDAKGFRYSFKSVELL